MNVQNNLKILVQPESQLDRRPISAELISSEGRLVDFQKTAAGKPIILNAPKPGLYKVIIGYNLAKAYWDSLSVRVEPSVINLPSSRYSTVSFKLFPMHPTAAKKGTITRFILPHDAQTQVNLFSTAGKKIKTIYQGVLSKGMHALYWETRDDHRRRIPPGSYLCELKSGSQTLVERIYISD